MIQKYDDERKFPRFTYRTDPARMDRVKKLAEKLGVKTWTKALDRVIDCGLENLEPGGSDQQ